MDETKNSFNHTDDQENREKDNIPKDDVFRLFANTPCCLVKQIIVSVIEEKIGKLLESKNLRMFSLFSGVSFSEPDCTK